MEMGDLLIGLVIVWLAAKLAGEGIERLGQTAVLGELLAGVIIGPGVLGLVHESEILHALAEIGLVILLFEIGLESDLEGLLRAGLQSTVVAVVGLVCPFALGYLLGTLWGTSTTVAVFIGATMTATSVGITARVLSDLDRLGEVSSKIVLGAAVLDDILGLMILAVVTGLIQTETFSLGSIGWILGKALVFLAGAIVFGIRFAPTMVRWVSRMRARGSLIVYAVLFCVLLAALSEWLGLATIVGAFAAGLILAKTDRSTHIDEQLKPVADLFVPVFFVTVGMKVMPTTLNPFDTEAGGLALALLLIGAAIAGKLSAGLAVYQKGVKRWPVGVGMVPRGEVGLVFAGTGLASGIIGKDLYAVLITMIMVTTFVVPPWLKAIYSER